ncbi:hypothetical protein BVC80_9057g70 [Macleaya cordata]|uniref:Uncharacterized protein n=1 Tax=Macleaya cordata TaxID=56857 RepID=A0A200R9T6_MACCD|nr:hypothetical protein BVC80_9057g70 [Macleaya cordata]
MKIINGVSSTNSANYFNLLLRGTKEVMIRKNNIPPHHQDLLLLLLRRRLKEYIIYSKLRSLIPPQPFHQLGISSRHEADGGSEELATEVEMKFNEIPPAESRDSDEEIDHNYNEPAAANTATSSSSLVRNENLVQIAEREEDEHTIVEFESEDDDDDDDEGGNGSSSLKPFVPSIKIKKMETTVLINTIVLKEVALTSTLFKILEEEEKLDIVSENQYRTETKVAHTIQVKVEPEYNIDGLEKKLHKWGSGSSSS